MFTMPARRVGFLLRCSSAGSEGTTTYSRLEDLARRLARLVPDAERARHWPQDGIDIEYRENATVLVAIASRRVHVEHPQWGVVSTLVRAQTAYSAVTETGRHIAMPQLLALGRALLGRDRSLGSRRWRQLTFWSGVGPVPGVRKYRGGPSGYCRRADTQAEKRQAALVLAEEGETAPRPARQPWNLPDAWDDIPRCRERNWKSQHKGRKAWDRPRCGPAAK